MKAIVMKEFGGPEVLELQDVPDPKAAADELVVEVLATSINPVDLKLRDHGEAFGLEPPAILGYDVSGRVLEVGSQVEAFAVGDEVFYTPELDGKGSYAEQHAVKASIVAKKPARLSHPQAAALPLAGCTASQALVNRARLKSGESVLIHGSGGVGLLALQIAKAREAKVIMVGSQRDHDRLEELGADVIIDYQGVDDIAAAVHEAIDGEGVQVVLDAVGGETLLRSLDVIEPRGRMVTILEDSAGDLGPAIAKNITVHYLMMERRGETMQELRALVEGGQLEATLDVVMPLAEAAEAQRRVAEGGISGKVILEP